MGEGDLLGGRSRYLPLRPSLGGSRVYISSLLRCGGEREGDLETERLRLPPEFVDADRDRGWTRLLARGGGDRDREREGDSRSLFRIGSTGGSLRRGASLASLLSPLGP